MLQKTIKHYLMLPPIFECFVKVRLLQAVPSYLSIMQYELPKKCLPERKNPLVAKAYSVLSKVILFILGHKNKNPQKVDILYDM